MVVENYKKYLLTFTLVVTILVFAMGIFIGNSLDTFRTDDLLKEIRQNELDSQSFLVEQQFVETFGGQCDSITLRAGSLQKAIRNTGNKLAEFENVARFENNHEYNYLKRKHMISKIQFFTLLQNWEKTCGVDYNIILFFYKIDDPISKSQGFELDKIAEQYPDTIILSVDEDYKEEPLVGLLAEKYSISKAPILIINEEKLEGFTTFEKIENYII